MAEEIELHELHEDFVENYELFIEDALATGCVWGLETEDGWALCTSEVNKDIDVMPLWSQPEYAQVHCIDEWGHYKVVPISLEELLDDWLPGMHEDVLMLGPNWNSEMEGLELEPLDVAEDFENTGD